MKTILDIEEFLYKKIEESEAEPVSTFGIAVQSARTQAYQNVLKFIESGRKLEKELKEWGELQASIKETS